jgi:hypothetical protein
MAGAVVDQRVYSTVGAFDNVFEHVESLSVDVDDLSDAHGI